MAPAATYLSPAEYDRLYGHESGWEYWFGEARRKSVPTYLHGILAFLLGELLRQAGYLVSGESDLQIVPEWRPRPDVYGILGEVEGKYVTKPVDVVFEILSEGDEILIKCQHYTLIGIPQIFAFDPEARTIQGWDGQRLVTVSDVKLGNGVTIKGDTIWSLFQQRQRRQEPPASKVI